MSVINQFSYILMTAGVLLGSYIFLRRRFRIRLPAVALIQFGFGAIFVTGFFLLRPGASTVSDFDVAHATINNGTPTFVEFFSNYCAGCIAVEPIVDRVVSQIEGEFDVIRVDIHTTIGREMRTEYEFSFTPEFVLFNADGQEVWRDHVPPSSSQLDSARAVVQ